MSALAQTAARLRPRGISPSLPRRWRRWALAALAVLLALAAAYQFWFRDSGLVAVDKVRVTGVPEGAPGARQLTRALRRAGRQMTTLDVQDGVLERAVQPFGLVRAVRAEASFPDTLEVRVSMRRPAAVIGSGDAAAVVAADGTIIRSMSGEGLDLPRLPLPRVPARPRLRGGALRQAAVLGAAPAPLQPFLDRSTVGESGVDVELRNGIELRFGSARQLARKWRAAAAVLSDPGLTALDYVDLATPERPAVGGAGHLLAAVP
ncbi:MAG: cell division protein FtsQ/DivIB [Solirubrobacterales bacterium]